MNKSIEVVVSWYDPDDPDQGTNTGFGEYTSKESMLQAMNVKLIYSPRLKVKAYEVLREIQMKPAEIVTKFVIG